MTIFVIAGYGKTANKIIVRVTRDEQEAQTIKEEMRQFFHVAAQERYVVTINEFVV